MGRKLEYGTPAELEKKINAYFDSISSVEQARQKVLLRITSKGKPLYALRDVEDSDGNPVMEVVYRKTPTIQALCMYLDISRTTFSDYGRRKGYERIVERARQRLEVHLIDRVATEEKIDGLKFLLVNNYGYRGG